VETILILDDSIAILGCIGDMLRFDHYSVLEASSGLQAIEISRKCGPLSLFVTDVQLPDGSGIDFALKLVALYPDLPVLVISGNPMDWWATKDISNFSRFSPNKVDFLEKPFSISELQMRVRNLIGRRPQRNEGGVAQIKSKAVMTAKL
jgi:DNA-binding response OmpR family regulator